VPVLTVEGVMLAKYAPPVETVYQPKFVPVAVKALAAAFWQRFTGLITMGAAGNAFTFTAICARALVQPLTDWVTK
jgi:hypothetical protein